MTIHSFNIHTLGCKVNQYDGNRLRNELLDKGIIEAGKNSDISIVFSCAVTKTAMQKLRTLLNRVRRENPEAKTILAGCAASVYKDCFSKNDLIIVANRKELNAAIYRYFDRWEKSLHPTAKKHKRFMADARNDDFQIFSSGKKIITNQRSRYFIKIQDGCNQFCSYCIIPYARGGLKSRSMEEVINEVRGAVSAGYEEVVLSGIHLGKYGKEKLKAGSLPAGKAGKKLENKNLLFLLKDLSKMNNLKRIRLSSIEINEVDDSLMDFMAKEKKMCRHLHLPLQSGSDKILKLMNRPYDKKNFKNKLRKIRKAVPDIAISTDVIVGFPGETGKDFQETMAFAKEIKFSRLHVFSFSAHEKTPAAKLPGRISSEIIKQRSGKLRKIGEKLKFEFERKFIGSRLKVLVEKKIGNHLVGKSDYYFDIKFDRDQIIGDVPKNIMGKIVEVKINK
jgi:threonylcarbamoyladenosine tRNA methylthiotransferase MtaB